MHGAARLVGRFGLAELRGPADLGRERQHGPERHQGRRDEVADGPRAEGDDGRTERGPDAVGPEHQPGAGHAAHHRLVAVPERVQAPGERPEHGHRHHEDGEGPGHADDHARRRQAGTEGHRGPPHRPAAQDRQGERRGGQPADPVRRADDAERAGGGVEQAAPRASRHRACRWASRTRGTWRTARPARSGGERGGSPHHGIDRGPHGPIPMPPTTGRRSWLSRRGGPSPRPGPADRPQVVEQPQRARQAASSRVDGSSRRSSRRATGAGTRWRRPRRTATRAWLPAAGWADRRGSRRRRRRTRRRRGSAGAARGRRAARPRSVGLLDAGGLAHDRHLGDVAVQLGSGQRGEREAPVGCGDRQVLGEVHPLSSSSGSLAA